MKKPTVIIIGIAVIATLFVLSKVINYGQTTGYYGDYNSIIQSLEAMPDIEIIKADYNLDTTLEEIYLTLVKDQKTTFDFYIGQDEPFRKTRGSELSAELKRRIDQKISNNEGIDAHDYSATPKRILKK